MAYAMTKQGSLDNCVTYEFMCDTVEDMNAIEDRYRTIGTVAIVLQGNSGLEVYIASSDKQWNSFSGAGADSSAGAGLSIHICGQSEVENGLPSVSEPDEATIYLVPTSDSSSGNLYDEYVYVAEAWEKFGSSGSAIDLSAYATKASPAFTGSISLGRASGSTIGKNSVAEGSNVAAAGNYSHAEGNGELYEPLTIDDTTYTAGGAYGEASHVEGYGTLALEYNAHAEGYYTIASGEESHAEGSGTFASGNQSHAEGGGTTATGRNSHVEGYGDPSATKTINNQTYTGTGAHGDSAHSEGGETWATGLYSHAEGYSTTASGNTSHAEGVNVAASGDYSHAEGTGTTASGSNAHAEGGGTIAAASMSHAEGQGRPSDSKTIGNKTYTGTGAHGDIAHAEGNGTWAIGTASHAEGNNTTASGNTSHAEGESVTASGFNSHAEGSNTTASGYASHAEGASTTASGSNAHAEGASVTASGILSHAEGAGTTASGAQSHAEGASTIAAGAISHVGGRFNVADSYANWPEWTANTPYEIGDKVKRTTGSGANQNVTGHICKIANSDASFSRSKWIDQSGKMNYVEIIGNGTSDTDRRNARALDWDGNEYLKGNIYVGCNADSTGGAKVATEAYVNARIPTPPTTNGTYILQAVVADGTTTYSWINLPAAQGVSF